MYQKLIIAILLFCLVIFAPFEFKLITVCVGVIFFMTRTSKIPRRMMWGVYFLLFACAYIYSPYWLMISRYPVKYPLLVGLTILGFLWSSGMAAELKIPKLHLAPPYLLGLAVALYVVVARALGSDIAYRGDEGHHVKVIMNLAQYIHAFWTFGLYGAQWYFKAVLIMAVVLGSVSLLFLKYGKSYLKKRARRLLIFSIVLFVPISAAVFYKDYFFVHYGTIDLSNIGIYPYLPRWLALPFVIFKPYGDIRSYRAVPFLALIGIAWIIFYVLQQKLRSSLLAFLSALVLTTIPLLTYYGSIVYLEMPVILLMLVCVLNLKVLLTRPLAELKSSPVWCAFILIAFMKETGVIYLALILGLRFIWQRHQLRQHLFSVFLVLCPLVVFLFFDHVVVNFKSYGFQLYHLFVPSNYWYIFVSLYIQTGIVLLTGLWGIYLMKKKDPHTSISQLVLLVGTLLFFLGDGTPFTSALKWHVGYSRWNLYLIPILLSTTMYFFTRLKKLYILAVLLFIGSLNSTLFPFNYDGVRLPRWGLMFSDIGDYTYPYEQSFHWLTSHTNAQTIVLSGQYSSYHGLPYYSKRYHIAEVEELLFDQFNKEAFSPVQEQELLTDFFQKINARVVLPDAILYHSVNNIELVSNSLYGQYRVAHRSRNSLHSIYIFTKV